MTAVILSISMFFGAGLAVSARIHSIDPFQFATVDMEDIDLKDCSWPSEC